MNKEQLFSQKFSDKLNVAGYPMDAIQLDLAAKNTISTKPDKIKTLHRWTGLSNDQIRDGLFNEAREVQLPLIAKEVLRILEPWIKLSTDYELPSIQTVQIARLTGLSPERVIDVLSRFPLNFSINGSAFTSKVQFPDMPKDKLSINDSSDYGLNSKRIIKAARYLSRPPGGGPVQKARLQEAKLDALIRRDARKKAKIKFFSYDENKTPENTDTEQYIIADSNLNEIQNALWGDPILDRNERAARIKRRIEKTKKGYLPHGSQPSELSSLFIGLLESFSPRVVIATNPENADFINPNKFAIAGGWCAIRTKDMLSISQDGLLMDPETGLSEQITSVEQVADWIEKSISFDQVIESIGAINASEYVIISESKLWSDRIQKKLSNLLKRQLTDEEKAMIERSIEIAEQKRAKITKRYIEYVTGNKNPNFKRIIDKSIWTELQSARDALLASADISLNKLLELDEEADSKNSCSCNELSALFRYVKKTWSVKIRNSLHS